jgi:hypothetical protein
MTDHPTPPPAAPTREEGWYWATDHEGNPTPLEWKHDTWWAADCDVRPIAEKWVAEIGPRIPTPAERAGDAALVDAIQWARQHIEISDAYAQNTKAMTGETSKVHGETSIYLRTLLAALTPAAPGSGTGWNEAIEAAAKLADEQFDSPPVDSMNVQRLGGWEDCADHLRVAIRALRKPSPPGAAEEGGR